MSDSILSKIDGEFHKNEDRIKKKPAQLHFMKSKLKVKQQFAIYNPMGTECLSVLRKTPTERIQVQRGR